LGRLETPVTLMPYRRIFLHYGKNLYQFEAIDFDVFMDHARFLFIDGNPERIRAPLMRGEGVLISEVFANQTGLEVGEHFQARILGFPLDMAVLGIFRDYRTQGGVVYYSLPRFRELTGDGSWGGVRIFLSGNPGDREGAAARLRGEILQVLGGTASSIEITTGRELHRAIMRIFDETFAVTGVLLVIALMVATLGIATTLTVLVLERTRQLHTLRAVGASFGQIRMMILWEAILMVFAGEIIGLACGFLLSRLLIFVVNRQSFGWTFIYSVDWGSILLSLPLILTTALAAALPAGQALFKRSPAQALKER
ncbi:MAG: FtsX-like permease family protein, partial [Syntrophobacteraceae bacterium]|nr:FtsX-like permease family protein [Syntrophobacteraceae bacterium]